MRIFIFFLLFFYSSNGLFSQHSLQADSILATVSHLSGEERILQLFDRVKKASTTPKEYPLAEALELESRVQKNYWHLGDALYRKVHNIAHSLVTTTLDEKEIVAMADEAKRSFSMSGREIKVEHVVVEEALFVYYARRNEYHKAMSRLEFFLASVQNDAEEVCALNKLGTLYILLQQEEKSIDLFLKAISICDRNTEKLKKYFENQRFHIYMTLWYSYYTLQKYTMAKETVDILSELIITQNDNLEWQQNMIFEIKAKKAKTLIALKKYGEAKEIIRELETEKSQSTYPAYLTTLDDVYANYYREIGDFENALKITDKLLKIYTKEQGTLNYINHSKNKAEILDNLHRYHEASLLKSEIIHVSDSIAKINMNNQLAQMQTTFEVERHKAEKEQAKLISEKRYMVGVALAVVCALLLLLIVMEKRNSKRLKEKNKKLFDQYKHISLENIKTPASEAGVEDDCIEITERQKLYNKVQEYLSSLESYIDVVLTREALAVQIGTNRQYLIEAIQDSTGMTYSEFTSYIRLEYARKLLLQNTDLTIEAISQLSGFNNKVTFYRHFYKKYGMTPAEFKEFVLEEKVEVHK